MSQGLRTLAQRQAVRQHASLPILTAQQDFLGRLERQGVVVVRAETGSGKTTQLPQYCAETYPGLVVCTQPRVIAAQSTARRIATEYDDAGVRTSISQDYVSWGVALLVSLPQGIQRVHESNDVCMCTAW